MSSGVDLTETNDAIVKNFGANTDSQAMSTAAVGPQMGESTKQSTLGREKELTQEAEEFTVPHLAAPCHPPYSPCAMHPSPPSPSVASLSSMRSRPFSLIEFGNVVAAALALDSDPDIRFSDPFLHFHPNSAHSPEERDADDHERKCQGAQFEERDGNIEGNVRNIKISTSSRPPPSPPPPTPVAGLSATPQVMKLKLKANWISTSRTILKKIRHAFHSSSSTPIGDSLSPDTDPGQGFTTASIHEAKAAPSFVPIPTVDLPPAFYELRNEGGGLIPFLPLAFQYECERAMSPQPSPDGISIFSRASSRITLPAELHSRPPSVHSDCGSTATHGHDSDRPDVAYGSDLASYYRWSTVTDKYDRPIQSFYSSAVSYIAQPSSQRSPTPESGSRAYTTASSGFQDLSVSYSSGPYPPSSSSSSDGSQYSQESLVSLREPLPDASDWTLALPLDLDPPLNVMYPSTSSGTNRSDQSAFSCVSDASTYASSSSSAGVWSRSTRRKARSCATCSSEMSSIRCAGGSRSGIHHYATTMTTLVTASSCRSWTSQPTSIQKPLPSVPGPPPLRRYRKGKEKEGEVLGVDVDVDVGIGLADEDGRTTPQATCQFVEAFSHPPGVIDIVGGQAGVVLKSAVVTGTVTICEAGGVPQADQESTTTVYCGCPDAGLHGPPSPREV